MILPSEMLKEIVDDIISIERSNSVLISLHLRNPNDASFAIDDANITTFTVEQNTISNVFDNIVLTCDIQPIQFQELITKQSDLYADVTIEYADRQTNAPILEEDPIVLRYKVFLHDMSSLLKRFGVNAFEKKEDSSLPTGVEDSTLIPISMQLILEVDHKINRGSFVGVIQDTNVSNAIRYVASVIGVPSIKMTEPDNPATFQHFNVPPENSGFRVVFDYIHKKYGVYANGFRYYLTNGTLYVYPPFKLDNTETPKLIIYRVSENSYAGSTNYHELDDAGNIQIVSNSKLTSKNLSNVGSENDGNTKVFIRSDGMIDGQVSKGKKLQLTNVTASMASKSDSAISSNAAVPKYVQPTNNVYEHGSKFSEMNGEIMTLGWANARMGLLYPSMPVSFVFDEKNKVMEKTGLLESITYSFVRANRHLFNCSVGLIIRVDHNQEEYDS